MFNPNIDPLAQDFVIAAQVPDTDLYFFHDPNLARLENGTLILAAPQWRRQRSNGERILRILRSETGGKKWEELSALPFEEGTPFLLDGQLLMFVQSKTHRNFQIVSSDDQGNTWSKPSTVLEGPFWNISTSFVTKPGAFYWAMDHDSSVGEVDYRGKVMVRLERGKSPLDPGAWSISNIVQNPRVPTSLTRELFPPNDRPHIFGGWKSPFVWLEPNTVDVNGHIRVFARSIIDEKATSNIAAVLDYEPSGNRLTFTQFTSWPGGQCKFFIVQDHAQDMYWMLSNLVTNSQDLLGWGSRMRETRYSGGPGNERRWLFLHYSIDCLNWFPAGCVARWPNSIHRSFMYPSAVIDNDDLVVLSRTSRDAADQHDADLCTIHRVSNFRSLAMDLKAGSLSG